MLKGPLMKSVEARQYIDPNEIKLSKVLPNFEAIRVWGANVIELKEIPLASRLLGRNYGVYVNNHLTKEFSNYNKALEFALGHEDSSIKKKTDNVVLWNNYRRYVLMEGNFYINSFEEVSSTIEYGKEHRMSYIIDQEENKLVWSNFDRQIEFTDETSQGDLFLINPQYPVSSEFIPNNMVNLANHINSYIRVSRNDMEIDEVAFNSITSMLKDAYYDGADQMVVISTYRSYQRQTTLFNNRVNFLLASMGADEARREAATSVAIPGSSEHQIGLGVDFSTLRSMGVSQDFGDTVEGKWLNNNSWKYGFVIRYTEEKMDITGIIDEPWHLRYVGVPHAELMNKLNLCLEEYLEYIKNNLEEEFVDHNEDSYKMYYFDSIYSDELLEFLYNNDNIARISGDGMGGIIITTNY